ncbi:MAG TPA: PhzF family phenazine biosynthesis protein [Actinomycetota bacterium]|nr:PhzF family phenazine biosynthesis protein [Actinomycetota bacterium]
MLARYRVVDVFAREPLAGNALAVFPDPGSVDPDRMQRIAREMNLSETTFVTGVTADGYDVRIFTPGSELPFAGHPTLGTAWVLRELGAVAGERTVQRSAAGPTAVDFDGDRVWLERTGTPGEDLDDVDGFLAALDLDGASVGFDASAFGARAAALRPAIPDAGLRWLMLPLASPDIVARLQAPSALPDPSGVYCFAPLGPGRIKARFFAADFGVAEDPATGSAAAALGIYLAARVGDVTVDIEQGAEVARPSFISVQATRDRVRIGGTVRLTAEASLVG